MPAVNFFVRLDLDPICLFPDGHWIDAVKSLVSAQMIARSASTICHLGFAIWHFHEYRLRIRTAGAWSEVACDCPGFHGKSA